MLTHNPRAACGGSRSSRRPTPTRPPTDELPNQANLKDGGAPALQTFVTLTLLFTFCLQLSGLLGLAFDPSRGT